MEAATLLRHFLAFPIQLHLSNQLHEQALALAGDFDLPAVYDAYYLAVASNRGAELWTADQRLLNAVGGRLPFVKALATYGA